MKTVTIIVPFYNEEESVDIFFTDIDKTLNDLTEFEFSFICIDDGSSDSTLDALKKQQNARELEIIEFSRNFGKESAITAGLDNFSADIAIIMDSDLQDPPKLISEMLQEIQKGYEVVTATRTDRSKVATLKEQRLNGFIKRITHFLRFKYLKM